ncbi:hypothetical protein CHELA1G11_20996 [Hyphomicrobiales bacterium]|nr:hypothetical protein CHELA1G11_20996 [Hyphomicrobiales bacterium]CAH1692898.1 hypothetical protein CHELA1G2_21311 [Hyphomicrobiales bacterium]
MSFCYEQGWLERTQLPHHPLSLALPLSADPYDHDRAGPVFVGLLPDSQQTRGALARYLQVDATDDYALLYQLGRDCPGTVRGFSFQASRRRSIPAIKLSCEPAASGMPKAER